MVGHHFQTSNKLILKNQDILFLDPLFLRKFEIKLFECLI